MIYFKKWAALKAGILFGLPVYLIDAIIWYHLPAGSNYPSGTFIREYWIGGIRMPHPNFGEYFWLKFGADFMMTFSYAIFAFGYLWVMFDNYKKKNIKEMAIFTMLFFSFWMLIPFLSFLIPLNDAIVDTVRYMDTQLLVWIVNAIVGYVFLSIIYATDKFGKKDPKVIPYVLLLGCIESFFMEFPLFISSIRPTGILFLFFEVGILFNQGAPYLYVIWDKIIPWLSKKIRKE